MMTDQRGLLTILWHDHRSEDIVLDAQSCVGAASYVIYIAMNTAASFKGCICKQALSMKLTLQVTHSNWSVSYDFPST